MNEIIRGEWVGEKENVRRQVVEKLDKLDELQNEIRNVKDPQVRDLLV